MSTEPRTLAVTMLLVGLIGIAATAPGTWVRATYGAQVSGDEPHYLLTAVSLAEDGDLDLANQFREEAYRPFHEIQLSPQGSDVTDERIVAPHDPLLPALVALPWRLAGWQGAKLFLALLNGVLGALLVWTAVRRFATRPVPTGLVVTGFVASAPLAVYGTQLYPELPAALTVLAAVAAGLGEPRARVVVTVVLAIVALPWLAVKYVPVAAALALLLLVRWWRAGARRPVVGALAAFAVAGIGFVLAHLAWYGGLTPYAASDFFLDRGGQLSVVGTQPNYVGRSQRLLGLLIDEDFGLAAWQPGYLLVVPAVAALVRARPDGWPTVVMPLAVGWLSATFLALTMHGWWFPGRQVVVVLPLAVLAVTWLADGSRRWLVATVGAATFGILAWGWLLADGWRGDLTMIVDFATVGNPLQGAWRRLLPDHMTVTPATWMLHGVWITAAAALVWAGWRSATGRPDPSRGAA